MVDNTTMYLTWEPPPARHLNGPLVGYKVNYSLMFLLAAACCNSSAQLVFANHAESADVVALLCENLIGRSAYAQGVR